MNQLSHKKHRPSFSSKIKITLRKISAICRSFDFIASYMKIIPVNDLKLKNFTK